jgi:hypothetical protein
VNDLSTSSPASDDTVEFQLSEDELLRISQAADAAQLRSAEAVPPVVVPKPAARIRGEDQSLRRRPRNTIGGWAGAAAIYAAFMAFAWWGVAAIPVQQTPHAAAAKIPNAAISRTIMPTTLPPATVQVRNPFDATELFEFPAGTTDAESHKKVAQLLWQRAHERQAQWAHIKPKVNLRMAKN